MNQQCPRHFPGTCGCKLVTQEETNSMITNRLLERIAVALEAMVSTSSKHSGVLVDPRAPTNPRTSPARPKAKTNDVQLLIAAYIDGFKLRYGPRARPDVGGKVQGQMRTLLKDHPLPRLIALVQAFLQMDDEWFKKKTHDFGTLMSNIGKVQTALLNGTARAEDKRYWDRVFGDGHDTRDLQKADRALDSELRREGLSRGADRPLLEGPRDDS